MSRTIVVSDLHGHRSLLENALEHAGYSAGDGLVVAGDLVDIGTEDTVGLAEELGATVLAGNHEVAAALGLGITPQNTETRERGPEFAERFTSGSWPLAAEVDGWVVTHAGLSVALDDIVRPRAGDVDAIVRDLNERFVAEMTAATGVPTHDWVALERFRLLGGQMGPLWFRPHHPSDVLGIRQITGHTPPENYPASTVAAFESAGLLLVDPGAHMGTTPGRFRYAIVEDGEARVVDSATI